MKVNHGSVEKSLYDRQSHSSGVQVIFESKPTWDKLPCKPRFDVRSDEVVMICPVSGAASESLLWKDALF